MPARSIATGTVSFGLVAIPVKLYSASESQSAVSFRMMHRKCGSRLKQQYVCTNDEEIVGRDDMAKGYEFARDQYVLFTDDEVKAMMEPPSKTIEIQEFVPLDLVDPIYFEGAYFLGPDKGGDRPYKLLAEAMRRTGRSALARWSARGKQYLVLVRPFEGGLLLQQLHYQDELRSFSEVPVPDAELKESEVQLALQLVEQISSDEFHPERYQDGVRKTMMEAIQRKVEGHEITTAPEEPRGQIIDLMEALKASLQARSQSAPAESASGEGATEERKPAHRAPGNEAGPRRVAAGSGPNPES